MSSPKRNQNALVAALVEQWKIGARYTGQRIRNNMNEQLLEAMAEDFREYLVSVKALNVEATVLHFMAYMRQSGTKVEQRTGTAFERDKA